MGNLPMRFCRPRQAIWPALSPLLLLLLLLYLLVQLGMLDKGLCLIRSLLCFGW